MCIVGRVFLYVRNSKYHTIYGDCSSVVEQRFVVPLAAGSIPVNRPIIIGFLVRGIFLFAENSILSCEVIGEWIYFISYRCDG